MLHSVYHVSAVMLNDLYVFSDLCQLVEHILYFCYCLNLLRYYCIGQEWLCVGCRIVFTQPCRSLVSGQ